MFDEVLEFWFGKDVEPPPELARKWFVRDAQFDAEIRERFATLYQEAVLTGMPDWRASARGELALIILFDQFSRNLFRDDPLAYSQDQRALDLSRELLASGRAKELTPVQRHFVLLPFQHSEDLATQREGVREYEQLAAEFPANQMVAAAWDYAKRHLAIIERFGRFPHRNKVLKRESTPEERAFLEQPDSSF